MFLGTFFLRVWIQSNVLKGLWLDDSKKTGKSPRAALSRLCYVACFLWWASFTLDKALMYHASDGQGHWSVCLSPVRLKLSRYSERVMSRKGASRLPQLTTEPGERSWALSLSRDQTLVRFQLPALWQSRPTESWRCPPNRLTAPPGQDFNDLTWHS